MWPVFRAVALPEAHDTPGAKDRHVGARNSPVGLVRAAGAEYVFVEGFVIISPAAHGTLFYDSPMPGAHTSSPRP